jgi:hypothetical protein
MRAKGNVAWNRKHLLGLEGFNRSDITSLLDDAEKLLPVARGEAKPSETLKHRTISLKIPPALAAVSRSRRSGWGHKQST